MPITLNGSGTVSGISVGGLPDGIIQSADLATGVGGKIINYAQTLKKDTASVSSVGQGAISSSPLISLDYTAASTSNKLLLSYTCHIGINTSVNTFGYLYIGGSVSTIIGDQGSSSQKRATSTSQGTASHEAMIHSFQTLITNPATSSTTYGIHFGHANNGTQTIYLNRDADSSNYSYVARFVSSITILEVGA